MMNQNKKNNGWILCPSKTFPGKFYYFNVVNGEAAWSLNDLENTSLRRDYRIDRVADKSHTYPEPSSPPMDNTPRFSFSNASVNRHYHNNIQRRIINNTQTPMFGQVSFSQYVDPYMSDVIWAPIRIPPPKFYSNQPYMPMQMPMHRPGQSCDPDHSLFVQSCDLSLSKRFEMYSHHSTYKPSENSGLFSKLSGYKTSTPLKSAVKDKIMNNSQTFDSNKHVNFSKPKEVAKPLLREPVLKRRRTVSDSEHDLKVASTIHKANSAESLINLDNSALMKPTIGSNTIENSKEKLDELDRNDLRYLLVAKRRKSLDLGDINCSESKKRKTTIEELPKTPPKKRVTFYLGDQSSDEADDQDEQNIETPEEEHVCPNDQDTQDTLLYIVTDMDTLLDEYEFIEKYVQSYDYRRLLIPHKLKAEIEAATHGDCGGRQRVLAARNLTRKLVLPPERYVLLPDSEDSPNSVQCLVVDNNADNYILNTCLMILEAGDRVMLVTNNTDLSNDAKSLNIDCYKPQELKDGAGIATKPAVSFELKKVPVEKSANLFLQPPSEFPSLSVKNKDEIPINTKKRLIEEKVDEKKVTIKSNNTNKDTSGTNNQMFSEKLIAIRKKMFPNMPDMCLKMQNLFIIDKPKNEKETTNVRFENGTEKRKESNQRGLELEDKNSLDDILSVFSVKIDDVIENITIRIDEFITCFAQIMENALTEVLTKNTSPIDKLYPPWVLYECARRIQDLYGSHTNLVVVTAKFIDMFLSHCDKYGQLKAAITPYDFMKMVVCGMVLIDSLKSIEKSISLVESFNSLKNLLQGMSHPPIDIPLFTSPVLAREDAVEERTYHHKKPSEIIEYLKAHYTEWKDFEIPQDKDEKRTKIYRTTGRDLNLLKIDNNKSITYNTRANNVNENNNVVNEKKTHNYNKIDGFSAIEVKSKTLNDNAVTKSPIFFRKFDSSFVFKKANDETKLTSSKNDTNIKDNANICNNNKTDETKHNYGPKTSDKEPKVSKIFDKLFKQNNEKVTTTIDDDLNEPKHVNTFETTAGPKVIRTFDNLFASKTKEKTITTEIIKDLNVPKHGNTFNQENESAGPKVIRNIKPIEAFEEKFKEKPNTLDLDALDYESDDRSEITVAIDNDSIDDAVSFVYAIKKPFKKPIATKFDEEIAEINDNAQDNIKEYAQFSNDNKINHDVINDNAVGSVINDSVVNNGSHINNQVNLKDDTDDSGYENENIHGYVAVKMFLTEFCNSFKAVHEFIAKTLEAFRKENVQEEKRRILHEKANKTLMELAKIIDELKSIIERESSESTSARGMVLKAGVQAANDKRITNYRQVVTKYLEQGEILESALKTVLLLTEHNLLDVSFSSDSDHSVIRYFNIFE